jgi:predicted transcriptional regulator
MAAQDAGYVEAGAVLGPPPLVVGVAVAFVWWAALARRVDEVAAMAEQPRSRALSDTDRIVYTRYIAQAILGVMGTTRVMISLPEPLLRRIDEAAHELGTSRSGLLRDAAAEYIVRRRGAPGDDPRIRLAHQSISALAERVKDSGAPDSVTVIRSLREARADPIPSDLS